MRDYAALELTGGSPAQSFTEPITLDEAKLFLKVTETADDDLITALIAAAREVAEVHQGRDLVEKQWDMTLDGFPGEIQLRQPLVSVDLVQYKDDDGVTAVLAENTDYIVDTAQGLVMPPSGKSWPSFDAWPTGAVLVRFTSGYAASSPFWLDAGKRVVQGMKMLIAAWYENRIPFTENGTPGEFPFAVTALFDFGSRRKVF